MIAFSVAVAILTLGVVAWSLFRRFGVDGIPALVEKRRASSRMVSRGTFVDRGHQVPVALALSQSTFFYENGDLQDGLDLHWVRQIEYDSNLASGEAAVDGKALRLICYGKTFEFVLPNDVVERWHMMLPPRRLPEPVTDGDAAVNS